MNLEHFAQVIDGLENNKSQEWHHVWWLHQNHRSSFLLDVGNTIAIGTVVRIDFENGQPAALCPIDPADLPYSLKGACVIDTVLPQKPAAAFKILKEISAHAPAA